MVSSIRRVLSTTLIAENLAKSFAGPSLFTGFSLHVESGLTAVTGRNGSGKTTLLKILAGLLSPTAGRVRVERDGRALAGDERRLAIGWAGPDLTFYGDLTGEENLRFFRQAAGRALPDAEIRRRLAETGLAETAVSRRVEEYSTGMRQRLRIAFALLFDPAIVLLDEPFTGLDVEGREIVHASIAAARRRGAVVLASNDERDFVEPDRRVALGSPAKASA